MELREPARGEGEVHGDGGAVERAGSGKGSRRTRRTGSAAGESAAVLQEGAKTKEGGNGDRQDRHAGRQQSKLNVDFEPPCYI